MNAASYVKEVKAEMKHVAWPTRRQVFVYTLIVIAVSLATALLLGLFDLIFSRSLGALVVAKPSPHATATDINGLLGGSGSNQGNVVPSQSPTPAAPLNSLQNTLQPGGFSPKATP